MTRFEGKTIVITGASRGIGRAIALRLAEEGGSAGATIGVNYLADAQAAEGVAEELRALGARAEIFRGDVRDEASVRALVAAAALRHEFDGVKQPPPLRITRAGPLGNLFMQARQKAFRYRGERRIAPRGDHHLRLFDRLLQR